MSPNMQSFVLLTATSTIALAAATLMFFGSIRELRRPRYSRPRRDMLAIGCVVIGAAVIAISIAMRTTDLLPSAILFVAGSLLILTAAVFVMAKRADAVT